MGKKYPDELEVWLTKNLGDLVIPGMLRSMVALESCPFLVSATEQAGSSEQHPTTPSLTGHSLVSSCARLITTPKVPEFVNIIKPPS